MKKITYSKSECRPETVMFMLSSLPVSLYHVTSGTSDSDGHRKSSAAAILLE